MYKNKGSWSLAWLLKEFKDYNCKNDLTRFYLGHDFESSSLTDLSHMI